MYSISTYINIAMYPLYNYYMLIKFLKGKYLPLLSLSVEGLHPCHPCLIHYYCHETGFGQKEYVKVTTCQFWTKVLESISTCPLGSFQSSSLIEHCLGVCYSSKLDYWIRQNKFSQPPHTLQTETAIETNCQPVSMRINNWLSHWFFGLFLRQH
jgi:hypothetical protein